MKNALPLHQDGGFPYQLSINNRSPKPIPAVDFSKKIQSNTRGDEALNKPQKIYGLGYVFINYPNGDYTQKRWVYPPQQRYQTPPVKDLQLRGAQTRKATSWSTSETTKVQIGSLSILYRYRARTYPKRPIATEPVNRGFCVLRSWRTGECSQQYSWKRRTSQGGVEGLPRSPGGCNQNA